MLGSGGVFVDADGNIGYSLLQIRLAWGRSLERSMVETSCQATTTWPCGESSHSCEAGSTTPRGYFFGRCFLGFVLKICWSWRIHNCSLIVVLVLPTTVSRLYIFSGPATTLGLYCSCGWCPQRLAIGGLGHHATCTAAHFAKTIGENDTTLIKRGVISHRESKL